jgi:ketosteroid isomerase-like protein
MNAKTVRFLNGTLLHRLRAGSANPRRWPILTTLLIAVALVALPVFSLFGGAGQTRAAPSDDPAAVVAAYVAAVNADDLEAILALYADDAVHMALPTPDGTAGICRGKEQFRLFYEQGVANRDRIEVEDGTLVVVGDRVTFGARLASDPWRKLGIESLESNAEAVVVDGRITSHVVMLSPGSARELLTALGAMAVPAGSH